MSFPHQNGLKMFKGLSFLLLLSVLNFGCAAQKDSRILVFSKTAGFQHSSIPEGLRAIQELERQGEFLVDTTSDAAGFSAENLARYRAVVFLNTTGDVLNPAQQTAMEGFIRSGGGYVGVHAAADTEYDWPWYGRLVGGYFESHPQVQEAAIDVVDRSHPATAHLPARWVRTDEWYNYKNLNPDVKVLALLDESSYEGGKNGDHHPIIWCHEFDGGRAFYTGGGHTEESYREPDFMRLLEAGIKWAAGLID